MNRVREPRALSMFEFVAMVAMLFATVAFSTDAMLPAFPSMAAELTPDAPNRIQLVIAAFMAGLGIGTLVTGPISDAYGRKPVVIPPSGMPDSRWGFPSGPISDSMW